MTQQWIDPIGVLCLLVATAWFGLMLAYPWLVRALEGQRPGKHLQRQQPAAPPHCISVVLAARNERDSIIERLWNLREQQLPAATRLEVVVVSDGSTDGTNELIEAWPPPEDERFSLRLLKLDGHCGKWQALQAAVAVAKGEMLAFTDATTHWEQTTLAELMVALQRPGVGAASGRVLYRPGQGGASAAFAAYQVHARNARSADTVHQTSVSGACHALWREIWSGFEGFIDADLGVPLMALEAGRRAVYAPLAVGWEVAPATWRELLKIRIRIGRLALQSAPTLLRRMLRRGAFGQIARLMAHKGTRWFIWLPTALGCAGMISVAADLAQRFGPQSLAVATLGGSVAVLAAAALLRSSRGGDALAMLLLANVAMLVALIQCIVMRRTTRWEPLRTQDNQAVRATKSPL